MPIVYYPDVQSHDAYSPKADTQNVLSNNCPSPLSLSMAFSEPVSVPNYSQSKCKGFTMITTNDVIAYVGVNGYGTIPMADDLSLSKGMFYVLSHEWQTWSPYIEKALSKVFRLAADGAYYDFRSPLTGIPGYNTDIRVFKSHGRFTICFAFER